MEESISILIEEATSNYRRHRNAFIAWVRKDLNIGTEEAKDAFQEAICAVYEQQALGRLNGFKGNLRTYLFAIGRNQLLTRLRDETIRGNHSAPYAIHMEGMTHANAQETMEREEDLEKVRAELDRLGPDDKRVLELYYIDRMNMRTIAEKMGYKNANVAKKKKCIALKRLMDQVRNGMMMFIF
jgi:RNA polymerase sigma factor (sigma-70 family)